MMSPLCVLIVGPARSGTSITAAVCQKLGVRLPADSIGPHPDLNPLGHFESRSWHDWSRADFDGSYLDRYDALTELVARDMKSPVWGVKDPGLCQHLSAAVHGIRENGSRVCVVAVHRPFRAVAQSQMRHSQFEGPDDIEPMVDRWDRDERAREEFADFYLGLAQVGTAGTQVHHLDYDRLIDNTFREVDMLAEFIFGDAYDRQVVEEASALVDPDLRHFGLPTLPRAAQVFPTLFFDREPIHGR